MSPPPAAYPGSMLLPLHEVLQSPGLPASNNKTGPGGLQRLASVWPVVLWLACAECLGAFQPNAWAPGHRRLGQGEAQAACENSPTDLNVKPSFGATDPGNAGLWEKE